MQKMSLSFPEHSIYLNPEQLRILDISTYKYSNNLISGVF